MGFDFIITDLNIPAPVVMLHQFTGWNGGLQQAGQQTCRTITPNLKIDHPHPEGDFFPALASAGGRRTRCDTPPERSQIAAIRQAVPRLPFEFEAAADFGQPLPPTRGELMRDLQAIESRIHEQQHPRENHPLQ